MYVYSFTPLHPLPSYSLSVCHSVFILPRGDELSLVCTVL